MSETDEAIVTLETLNTLGTHTRLICENLSLSTALPVLQVSIVKSVIATALYVFDALYVFYALSLN